ncbi:MAG TPA: translocation/assembly module TamB, partial [Ruegeria sp.]|nr:translocation/assembly module TamB [Ruegeria sp.]
MKPVVYPLAFALTLSSAVAQTQSLEESGGLLVDFLEDTLSGEGRNIRVRGLSGALSARATIEEITVADADGVWLTIRAAELDWNRLALLRGRFSVNTLTAAEIDIARAPLPAPAELELPDAAATPFQVPELPVAVELGELGVETLTLGAPLLGVAATLSIGGNLTLADGALDTTLSVTRLDRPGDKVDLVAGFANETRQITLDLTLTEAAGGLIATTLAIPDAPALMLSAKGAGPVDDFTADIGLSSDAVERVSGQVRLRGTGDDTAPGIAFAADLGGDVTPLLDAAFDPFFGADTRLGIEGVSLADGALRLDRFDLRSDALDLSGALALAAGGALERAVLDGRITPPDGTRVTLPVPDQRITLGAARLAGRYDRAQGDGWSLNLSAEALDTPDL